MRALAAGLGVSPGTVAEAWGVLRKHRMIATLGRRGSVVSGPPTVPHPTRYERVGDFGDRLALDLAVAAPDPALLPPLENALLAGARTPRLNDYARTAITDGLLAAVRDTWPYRPDAWMAVGGGYEGVQLLCQALLVPGDRVAVEDPTAARLLDILEALDAQAVPVACDDQGPLPGSLAQALEARPALTDKEAGRCVREAARRYDARRSALAERLAERGVHTANRDGLMLWVPVVDETSALVTLAARGITVSPGSRFCVSYARPHVRVATSRLTRDGAPLDEIAELIALAASSSAARME